MKIIILAGGRGSRLWPISRKDSPKQFLQLEKKSFFQQTIERSLLIEKPENIFISTNEKYISFVEDEIKNTGIKKENIIVEPFAKNTAPAILFALNKIKEKTKKNELAFVCPSDHYISPKEKFVKAVNKAKKGASLSNIVTFGITPVSPATGYGYIKKEEERIEHSECYRVEKFTEKPCLKKAKQFISSDNYLWNSGMFLFPIDLMVKEFKEKASNIYNNINNFEKLESIPIDKAVIEKSNNVATIPVDFKWNDIGCWKSFYQMKEKDQRGNVLKGDVLAYDVENSLVLGENKTIACIGLKNITVIETNDVTFIAPKSRSQEVKKLVKEYESRNKKTTNKY
ncbi:MAG: mannose-1-phosphate guanylyltransferase [Minisyncoccales bacterium]